MGICCDSVQTQQTTDFPDKYFTYFKREKPMRKEYEISISNNKESQIFSENFPILKQEQGIFCKDINEFRPAFSKMICHMQEFSWKNWKETEEKVDTQELVTQGEDYSQKCIVIKPKDYQGAPLPCLMFAFGGALVIGEPSNNIRTYQYVSQLWNICVIIPNYRLAPEHKPPAGSEDFKNCFLQFHANAESFNIDPNRMAMAGQSAGAHVVLGALRQMLKTNDISKVRVAFLEHPMISCPLMRIPDNRLSKEDKGCKGFHLQLMKNILSTDYEKQFSECDPDLYPGLMPEHELRQMPMMFAMSCEFDPCRHDAFLFAKRLQAVNKLAGISDVAGVGHSWTQNGNIPRIESWYKEYQRAFEAYTHPL